MTLYVTNDELSMYLRVLYITSNASHAWCYHVRELVRYDDGNTLLVRR